MSKRAVSYRAYGLTLRSSLVFSSLRQASRVQQADVRLAAGNAGQFAPARAEVAARCHHQDWFQYHRFLDGTTYLRWIGLSEFLVSPDGRRIAYRREQRGTSESFSVYLLGQVLSFSLLAFGWESLHSTVVVINGGAVAFSGDCGYGKSTLGAALLARGYPILTDDLMVIAKANAGWAVHPGAQRLKLFPDIARTLFGSTHSTTAMNDGTTKLIIPLSRAQTVRKPVPLKALYMLSDPCGSKSRLARVRIERLPAREAFFEVIRAAFNVIVLDRERAARQFAFATQLVASVPVRRLMYPRNLSVLPDVCEAVLEHLN
jgi:hypothetical protein